jgi:urease accessory protein
VAPRAYASTVHIADDEATVLTGEDAVPLLLPGGGVTTAWGTELHRVVCVAGAIGAGRSARVGA